MVSKIDTASTGRIERRKLRTREAIKQAARTLLIERGYRGVTIAAVTDLADIGYGTFYLHFHDKDDLMWEVIHEYAEYNRRLINTQIAEVPSPRREYLAWVGFFRAIGNERDSVREIFGPGGSAAILQHYTDFLADVHREHMEQGFLSPRLNVPIEVLAQFMGGALMRLLLWWIEGDNNYSAEQMAAMMYEAVYREPPPGES